MKRIKLSALLLFLACAALAQELIPSAADARTPAQLAADSVLQGTNDGFKNRLALRRILWETVWENPREGATPQAVVEAMGTKAALIFTASTLDATFFANLAAAKGVTVSALIGAENVKFLSMPAGWQAAINGDGSVTLTAP